MSRRALPLNSLLCPSDITDAPWLIAAPSATHLATASIAGHWLVFVKWGSADVVWSVIRSATIEGSLGPISRISTRAPRPDGLARHGAVIGIAASTADDEAERVRQQLRSLGVSWSIPFAAGWPDGRLLRGVIAAFSR